MDKQSFFKNGDQGLKNVLTTIIYTTGGKEMFFFIAHLLNLIETEFVWYIMNIDVCRINAMCKKPIILKGYIRYGPKYLK